MSSMLLMCCFQSSHQGSLCCGWRQKVYLMKYCWSDGLWHQLLSDGFVLTSLSHRTEAVKVSHDLSVCLKLFRVCKPHVWHKDNMLPNNWPTIGRHQTSVSSVSAVWSGGIAMTLSLILVYVWLAFPWFDRFVCLRLYSQFCTCQIKMHKRKLIQSHFWSCAAEAPRPLEHINHLTASSKRMYLLTGKRG